MASFAGLVSRTNMEICEGGTSNMFMWTFLKINKKITDIIISISIIFIEVAIWKRHRQVRLPGRDSRKIHSEHVCCE